jgi:hypothetical protein
MLHEPDDMNDYEADIDADQEDQEDRQLQQEMQSEERLRTAKRSRTTDNEEWNSGGGARTGTDDANFELSEGRPEPSEAGESALEEFMGAGVMVRRPRGVNERDEYGEEDEESGEEEVDDSVSIETEAAKPLDEWMLGKDIFQRPPGSSEEAVAGSICNWHEGMEGTLRPVRALCIQRSLQLRQHDGSMLGYKSFADPATNNRMCAHAALEGLCFDYAKKGHYIPGSETILKDPLPEDEAKKRVAESKLRIDQYLFEHKFVSEVLEDGTIDPNSPHYPATHHLQGGKKFRYSAFSQQLWVEPLYAPAVAESGDEHGVCVGTRLWVMVYNPRHSTTAHVIKIMEENQNMHKCGRAGSCPNEARGHSSNGPERAARQQRAFCAHPDNAKYGTMKYMSVTNVGSYCDRIFQAAGQDSGGDVRTPLGSMESLRASVGTRAIDRGFTTHETLGSVNALTPDNLFNARRGGNPPQNIFPQDEYPSYKRRDDPENAINPAMQAFMVTTDGMPIAICNEQINPNSYYDDDGYIKFPFEACYIARATDSFADSGMPLRLPSSISIGDAALECFYMCESPKINPRVENVYNETRGDLIRRLMMSGKTGEQAEAELQRTKRPNFNDMRNALQYIFDDHLRPDRSPVGVRRAMNQTLLQHDSMDTAPGEMGLRQAGHTQDGVETPNLELATEALRRRIDQANQYCVNARKLMQNNPGHNADTTEKKFCQAMRDVQEWGVYLFDSVYMDSRNSQRLWPKAREIRFALDALIRKLPRYATHAKVDRSDPRHACGSINYAFLFNSTRRCSKLSVYGEWRRHLARIYSSVCGIHGRVFADRWALHIAAFQPACSASTTFNPMIFVNGRRGLGKSVRFSRMSAMFNGEYDDDLTCTWWSPCGDMSAFANQAGGIAVTGGGVNVADEALPAMVTTDGKTDDTRKNQANIIKQLATSYKVVRRRTVTVTKTGTHQETSYTQRDDTTRDNSTTIGALNLSPNMWRGDDSGKRLPPCPGEDTRALLDRTITLPATETTTLRCTNDQEFAAKMRLSINDCLLHGIVARLTYIICEMVSLVPQWRAANREDAQAAWDYMDKHLLTHFDIPLPDPRRRAYRETIGDILSVESAVVRYLMFKEEAVAFPALRPTSKPFSQKDNPKECIHTLAPFSWTQICDIMQLITFDAELMVDVFTHGFPANLATNAELYHALGSIADLHGCTPVTANMSMRTSNPEPAKPVATTQSQDAGPAAEAAASPPEQADASSAPMDVDSISNSDGVAVLGKGQLPNITFDYNPHSPIAAKTFKVVAAHHDERRVVQQTYLMRCQALEHGVIQSAQQKLMREYTERCAEYERFDTEYKKESARLNAIGFSDLPAVPHGPKPCIPPRMFFNEAKIEAVMGVTLRNNIKFCTMVDGSEMRLDKACDLLMPTAPDVLSCGYTAEDIQQWLRGHQSHNPFDASMAELVFLGTPMAPWIFQRNKNAQRNSPTTYDVCWRCRPSNRRDAVASAEDNGAAPGAEGASGSAAPTPSSFPDADRELRELCKHVASISLRHFHIGWEHFFDRIKSVTWTPESYSRMVTLAPPVTEMTDVKAFSGLVPKTVMCTIASNITDDQVGTAEIDSIVEYVGSVNARDNKVQNPMPVGALTFRGTHSSMEKTLQTLRRPREWLPKQLLGLGDLNSHDTNQRRLDKLVAENGLPACYSLMSHVVRREPPIKMADHQVYFSSSFLVRMARLHVEVPAATSQLPGMRSVGVGDESTDSGNNERPSPAAESVEDVRPTEKPEDAKHSSAAKQKLFMLRTIEAQVRQMREAKRSTINAADVDAVVNKLSYRPPGAAERPFDEFSIYLSMKLHNLFNEVDVGWHDMMMRCFPAVFSTMDDIRRCVPEAVTSYADLQTSSSSKAPVYLISVERRVESVSDAAGVTSRKKRRLDVEVTDDDLAIVQDRHYFDTGVLIEDDATLRAMALKDNDRVSDAANSVTERNAWRESMRQKKVDAGHMLIGTPIALAVQDIGIECLSKVRQYYARNPEEKCPVKSISEQAAYLRPYTPPQTGGTCREFERQRVEAQLHAQVVRSSNPKPPAASKGGAHNAGGNTSELNEKKEFGLADESTVRNHEEVQVAEHDELVNLPLSARPD